MNDQSSKGEKEAAEKKLVSLATFLESVPPGKEVLLIEEVIKDVPARSGMIQYVFKLPEIQLHCQEPACNGIRFFRSSNNGLLTVTSNLNRRSPYFIHYLCKNCSKTSKLYAINLHANVNGPSECLKVGELPPFGPPVPARVIKLMGSDRETFLKGRRAENQGLGIGAFAYYRRIVESHKDKLIDELIRACTIVAPTSKVIKDLQLAKKKTQFSEAVKSIKHGLPQGLLIKWQHNPLTLLHSALSQGLHETPDDKCLELAHDIRVVLTDLVEKTSLILKEESELNAAISRLMKSEKGKPDISSGQSS